MTDFKALIDDAAIKFSDNNSEIVNVSRCATKDPTKVMTASYDSRMVADLKALHGAEFSAELEKVIQAEIDKEYARVYEGYIEPPRESSVQTVGDYTIESNVNDTNGISLKVTKNT